MTAMREFPIIRRFGVMNSGSGDSRMRLFNTMKNQPPSGPIHPETRALIHETIATRAYELWEKKGRPTNQALDHWLDAERELLSGRLKRRSISLHLVEGE
jgi:hypothetical protein